MCDSPLMSHSLPRLCAHSVSYCSITLTEHVDTSHSDLALSISLQLCPAAVPTTVQTAFLYRGGALQVSLEQQDAQVIFMMGEKVLFDAFTDTFMNII